MTLSAIPIGRFTPGTEDWVQARSTRLGGSEIAAVLGLSPFESRFSLWHRKMGTIGATEQRPEMEWGNRLEPVVLAKFFEGPNRHQYGGQPGSYLHPERPWQMASPDALVSYGTQLDALVEAKTALYDDNWGPSGTDEIPVYYRCQVLWNLNVFGLRRAHIPVLIGGWDYREYVIELDDRAQADTDILLRVGREFSDFLTSGQRPDIDAHDQTLQVVRQLHPDIELDDVEIDSALAAWYLADNAREKEAKAGKQHAASRILDRLGKARNAVTPDGERIAYRKPNGDHPPFLCPDPKAVKARTTPPTIQGSVE